MQLRTRNDPFARGGQQQQAARSEEDDFFSGWDTDTSAKAPASASVITPPTSHGYGIRPPPSQGGGIQPPVAQGYGIQPPGASFGGVQPPQMQQQQQQQQFPDQAQWQQPQQQWQQPQQQQQQFGFGQGIMPPQQSQQPNAQELQQQMGNLAVGLASSYLAGGGGFGDPNMQNVVMQQGFGIANNALRSSGFSSWFPNFYRGMQMQFNVSHSFVMRKLLLLLCPFPSKQSGVPDQSNNMDGFKVNVNEPDLYIPLMSFVSYCLLYCVQRGILSEFKPEVLGSTFSVAMFTYILEVLAAKAGFFLAGSPVPVLELMGNCGYKFVHVLIMVLIRIASENSYIYYPLFFYLAGCSAYGVFRFMSSVAPSPQSSMQQPAYGQYGQYGGQPQQPQMLHKNIVLILAASQIFLCWWLTPSVGMRVAAPVASAAAATLAPA
jgi:hypothetical protein